MINTLKIVVNNYMRSIKYRNFQFRPPETIKMTEDAFIRNDETAIYWLTAAGVMINSHGTILLIDPCISLASKNPSVSEVWNMKLLVLPPIYADQIKKVDAVLYTHADEDHLGTITLETLAKTGTKFYGTSFTCKELVKRGIPEGQCVSINTNDQFSIGDINITATPADHAWQLEKPESEYDWYYSLSDCCGFKFKTSDGVIWIPGDSLLQSTHLTMKDADVVFIDFSEDDWHFGRRGGIRIFNALKKADMIVYHCGTFYAPNLGRCNANPFDVINELNDPSRLKVLAPGEKYVLKKGINKSGLMF